MKGIALTSAVLLTGCFYFDPINQRPSLDIQQVSSAEVHRGDAVALEAIADDPDGQGVAFAWSVRACADATVDGGCEAGAFYESTQEGISFAVPASFAAPGTGAPTPVQSLFVVLGATDTLGATARPQQQLVIPVRDAAPTLALRKSPRHQYVVNTAVDLYAMIGDFDDGPASVAADWVVFSPPGAPDAPLAELAVPQDPNDPDHVQLGKTLVPTATGDWTVQVTATDPLQVATVDTLMISVVADHAPCLAQWDPIATSGDAVLPLTEDTLFQVPVVLDDLDAYPPMPGDPVLGTTAFAWSILPPGATAWQPLVGAAGNSAALAHDAYAAGSIVGMRVEIADRNHTPVTCAASDPTCSVISDPLCIQRQTWRVELH